MHDKEKLSLHLQAPNPAASSTQLQGARSLQEEGGALQNPAVTVKQEPGLQEETQNISYQDGSNMVPSSEQIMAELIEKEVKS